MNLSKDINAFSSRKDLLNVLFLILIATIIFHNVFYTEYLYTDESVFIWVYNKGARLHMFTTQGRYLTDQLFQWLFSRATTIHEVIYLRLFSFFGWLICIPIWYFTLKKIVTRERLPGLLTVFSVWKKF